MVPEFEESERPCSHGPDLFVRRLKAGESFTICVLSEKFWGLRVHWDGRGRRTQPHWRDKKICPGCKLGWPSKWKGYLHVLTGSGEEVFEFTPQMEQQILDQVGAGPPLRGQRFGMQRGKGDKARVKISLLPHYNALKTGRALPPAKDPKPILLDLWGLGYIRLGDDDEPPVSLVVSA